MYSVLFVSPDRTFLAQAQRFLPNLDRDIVVVPATDIQSASDAIGDGAIVDAVVFDHCGANDFFSAMDTFDRMKLSRPMVMLLSDSDPSVISEAVNRHVDAHIIRSGRNNIDLFQELDRRIVMVVERDRNDRERHVNERRMEALIKMAKMSDRPFQEIVNYALEASLELTGSTAGYVAMYDRERNSLNMLAWSKGAMRRCDISDRPGLRVGYHRGMGRTHPSWQVRHTERLQRVPRSGEERCPPRTHPAGEAADDPHLLRGGADRHRRCGQ